MYLLFKWLETFFRKTICIDVLVCCSLKPLKANMIFIFPLQSCKILLRMTGKLQCYDSFRHKRMHLLHNF